MEEIVTLCGPAETQWRGAGVAVGRWGPIRESSGRAQIRGAEEEPGGGVGVIVQDCWYGSESAV